MDISQIVILIFCLVVIYLIVKFVTKFFFRISLIILILLISYFSFFHFYKENIFDLMTNTYCIENEESKNVKCDCFVNKINEQLNDSYNFNEIEKIKGNSFKSTKVFLESYNLKKNEIRNCFEKNGFSAKLVDDLKENIIKKTRKINEYLE